jgi:hypothetical protein
MNFWVEAIVLIGPIFVLAETMFKFGYRPNLKKRSDSPGGTVAPSAQCDRKTDSLNFLILVQAIKKTAHCVLFFL